jgi:nitrogen fixation protein NifX
MKVAFATQDLATVDAHFGWAKHIIVYEVTPECSVHVETHDFGGDLQEDGDEDKLAPKIEAVKGCAILYVAAIGGSGAARVVARKIHPVKVKEPELISEVLRKLQTVLRGTPAPWLRKAMQKGQEELLNLGEA